MPDDQYPPSGQPPPPYGQPQSWPPPPGGYPGGYYVPPPAPPVNATMILVFGILGIVTTFACGTGAVFDILAWVFGNSALQTLDRVGDPWNQRGMVNAGRLCGIIGLILVAFGFLFYGLMILLGINTPGHDPTG